MRLSTEIELPETLNYWVASISTSSICSVETTFSFNFSEEAKSIDVDTC